jgi:hypothetical protein
MAGRRFIGTEAHYANFEHRMVNLRQVTRPVALSAFVARAIWRDRRVGAMYADATTCESAIPELKAPVRSGNCVEEWVLRPLSCLPAAVWFRS